MNIELTNVSDLIQFAHINKLWETIKFAILLNIFNILGSEGRTISELTKILYCDEDKLQHIITTLIFLGLIKEEGKRIFNTTISRQFLTDEKHNNLSSLLLHAAASSCTADNLMNEVLISNVELTENDPYMPAMDVGNKYIALKVAKIINKRNAVLLDLGCGSGIFSITACNIHKDLRSVCIDKESILTQFKKKLSQQVELQKRIQCLAGDIESLHLQNKQYDFVLLSNILHFFDKEKIKAILARCYTLLKQPGIIIINDIFVHTEKLYNILMSLEWLSNGISFITKLELEKILRDVNFINFKDYQDKIYPGDLISAEK